MATRAIRGLGEHRGWVLNSMQHAGFGSQDVLTAFPGSPLVVMKFGGTSVSATANWRVIAALIEQRLEQGLKPVLVHSALAGVSNTLQALPEQAKAGNLAAVAKLRQKHGDLAAELDVDPQVCAAWFDKLEQLAEGIRLVGEVSPRVMARIMATGELAATALGTAFLQRKGLPVQWLDARDLLSSSPMANQSERTAFLSAVCHADPDPQLQSRLLTQEGMVVTQGFIASNAAGETVLLGRGGSDTSAAYLAARLGARRLEIWTDVPGMFSTDPQAVASARLLRTLHYREAQEIASAGGGVLHPRCIAPVHHEGIPLFLKCTAHPEWEGTVVSGATGEEAPRIKAISRRKQITLVSMESMAMWQEVGFLAQAFDCFRRHGLSVDLVSTSESNVTVSLDLAVNVTEPASIDRLIGDLERICRVRLIEDCAAVTLVGRRIRANLHQLGPALEVFGDEKIHLLTQASNDLNLTVVVDEAGSARLVKVLHDAMISSYGQDEVFGPTLEQLRRAGSKPAVSEPPWWVKRREELLDLARQHGAAYVYERDCVQRAVESLQRLRSIDAVLYAMKANSHPELLRVIDQAGARFECVSPGEIRRLQAQLPRLDSRRILFTPNFAPREEYSWALEQGVWVTLDNVYPLRHWPELFAGKDLFLRIDPGQGHGHHEHVRTAGIHSKFGIPVFELQEVEKLVAQAGARVLGLHAHTGSGVLKADSWRETGEQLARLRDRFTEVRYLDLGGGLGIPEKHGELPLDLAELDESIAQVREISGGAELWLEPGRFLVARAGVLLARVTQTKGKGEKRYVGICTGMNSLIRPALYGAYHEIVNLSRLGETPTEMVSIVGPNCETGDRLGTDRLLPPTLEGDVIAIINTGAYGYAMSSRYNLREPAVEVVI